MVREGLSLAQTVEFERFSAALGRRTLGLDHELTPEDERIAGAAEAALAEAVS